MYEFEPPLKGFIIKMINVDKQIFALGDYFSVFTWELKKLKFLPHKEKVYDIAIISNNLLGLASDKISVYNPNNFELLQIYLCGKKSIYSIIDSQYGIILGYHGKIVLQKKHGKTISIVVNKEKLFYHLLLLKNGLLFTMDERGVLELWNLADIN